MQRKAKMSGKYERVPTTEDQTVEEAKGDWPAGISSALLTCLLCMLTFRTEKRVQGDPRRTLPKHLRSGDACKGIILFDGVCNLCDGTMHFVHRFSQENAFAYTQIQSEATAPLLEQLNLNRDEAMDRFTYVDLDRALYTRGSTAALDIAYNMRFPFYLMYAFIVIPERLRDIVYDYVAANRYRWMGKTETCHRPSPEMRSRFIQS